MLQYSVNFFKVYTQNATKSIRLSKIARVHITLSLTDDIVTAFSSLKLRFFWPAPRIESSV